ncbi:MAG: ribbon-helix-helix domain-containing protein [bacterium]|nr:ribbon-helix-helix domain-containing protein [bacterium]
MFVKWGDDVKERKKNRTLWSTSTDYYLHLGLKNLSKKTRIPSTRLLDEAIQDLLEKYGEEIPADRS